MYRAEQPALGREAVIKVLHARHRASETCVQRFLREARLASRLDHPYAAHIYAFGAEPDGVLWIAMELVRGTPLDRCSCEPQGPLPLERFVPLLERICEVVHTAHEQGIVHRDLKPANVMVLSRAGRLLPKLLDFGIAKRIRSRRRRPGRRRCEAPVPADATSDDRATRRADRPARIGAVPSTRSPRRPRGLTERGVVIGSPALHGARAVARRAAVDARTDIYALGVLAFEALTGRLPFDG